MLRASKICDQQTTGKVIRPYLNGVGYQLRLAEAIRKLVALALPNIKKTIRYKSKNGKPSRPVVDPRLKYAQVSLRRDKRALDSFDQWNNREVGAHPVQEDQSKIPYICLGDSSENETENRKLHPKKWMGKELKNNNVDGARSLVSLLTYLMPPFQLGNMKGDAKLEDGNLKIPKEEVVSEPETNPPNGESDSDDESDDAEAGTVVATGYQTETDTLVTEGITETGTGETEVHTEDQTENETAEPEEDTEKGTGVAETKGLESDSDIEFIEEVPKKPGAPPLIIEVEDMETEERIDGIKVELKPDPEQNLGNPIPTTSTASVMDPTMGAIQAQIQQLSNLFYQHLNKTSSIIEATQSVRDKAVTVTKEEPKEEPKEPDSDTDKCIQNLEDHIASTQTATESPNPQVPEADSGAKETQTTATQPDPERQQQMRKDVLQDSDTGSQGIEEVVSSDSSQEEVTVDPTNFDLPEEATNDNNQPAKREENNKQERNNNKEKQMFLPSARNSHAVTNKKARQLLVHQVPVSFPVAGNLMESAESIGYVYDALLSINAPRDLPGDVVVNATLLNRLENNQDRATLIVELDTEDRCNQILRNAKNKRAQDKKFAYYVTPTPQRLNSRNISYSDEEIQTGNNVEHRKAKKSSKKHKHTSKEKEKEPKPNYRGTPNAGTPKKQRREPESDGPSKMPKVRPENVRPTNAVSTPLPGTSRINPDASIDHLAELVRGLKDVDPVPRTDNPRPPERTLDTSELDMGMTVEVENDLYVGGNLFENTTAPIPTEQETMESVRQECLAREIDLAMEIESFRRRAQEWSEDLRHRLERRGRPGPANQLHRNKDLRGTRRRKSGPSDLRYSKLKAGREKDLRDFIKPKRRTSSASPDLINLRIQ